MSSDFVTLQIVMVTGDGYSRVINKRLRDGSKQLSGGGSKYILKCTIKFQIQNIIKVAGGPDE